MSLEQFIESKYYTFIFLILIIYLIFFHNKFIWWISIKKFNKLVYSKHEVVNEIREYLLKKEKLREKYHDFYKLVSKSQVYFMLMLLSLVQYIIAMFSKEFNYMNVNVCLITMVISFLEFRDNRRTYKKIVKILDAKFAKIGHILFDYNLMATEDEVLDYCIKNNFINEKDRLKIIKDSNRNVNY